MQYCIKRLFLWLNIINITLFVLAFYLYMYIDHDKNSITDIEHIACIENELAVNLL